MCYFFAGCGSLDTETAARCGPPFITIHTRDAEGIQRWQPTSVVF